MDCRMDAVDILRVMLHGCHGWMMVLCCRMGKRWMKMDRNKDW